MQSRSPDSAPFQIPSLDGLRAVSILIVFVSHAGAGDLVPGGFGVTVFFVVSGYLITTLLRRELERTGTVSIRSFYLRRVFRILPLFYVVLTLTLLATVVFGLGRGRVDSGSAIAQYLHVSNYWSITQVERPVMDGTGVYWSLAIEEHFYLIFPVLYLVLSRRLKTSQLGGVLALICVAVLTWRTLLVYAFDATEFRTYYATDTRIDSILIGCVLAIVANPMLDPGPTPRQRLVRASLAGATILATLAIRDAGFRESLRYSIQSVAIVFILAYVVAVPRSAAGRVLNFAPLAWFGRLSYAFYLVHLIVIYELQKHFSTVQCAVGAFVISTIIAVALQHLVERPALQLRQRLFPPSRSALAPDRASLVP